MPNITVYYDSWNNWLYLDWYGELTLPVVQQACLKIARLYIGHCYPRVLNSNAQVTNMDWQILDWLAQEVFPFLSMAGVEQVVWVYGTSLRVRDAAFEMVKRMPHLAILLFEDIENAVSWLQQMQPIYTTGKSLLSRPATISDELKTIIDSITQRLQAK